MVGRLYDSPIHVFTICWPKGADLSSKVILIASLVCFHESSLPFLSSAVAQIDSPCLTPKLVGVWNDFAMTPHLRFPLLMILSNAHDYRGVIRPHIATSYTVKRWYFSSILFPGVMKFPQFWGDQTIHKYGAFFGISPIIVHCFGW